MGYHGVRKRSLISRSLLPKSTTRSLLTVGLDQLQEPLGVWVVLLRQGHPLSKWACLPNEGAGIPPLKNLVFST